MVALARATELRVPGAWVEEGTTANGFQEVSCEGPTDQ